MKIFKTMMADAKILILTSAVSIFLYSPAFAVPKGAVAGPTPVDYVSTLVGTLSKHSLSTGNTYPATAMPWGMNFWTPQTGRMGDGWAYVYTEDKIRGLKQTHQPSPWINDYGQFSLMPVTGEPVFGQDERASWFSHKAETATPYYYSVYLADHDVFAEVAPTERAAAFRLTYPDYAPSYLVVDAFDNGSFVKVIPEENKIVGYTTKNSGGVPENFKNWFVIVADQLISSVQLYSENQPAASDLPVSAGNVAGSGNPSGCRASEIRSEHAGAVVGFKIDDQRKVNLRVASSFISLEQAELNLNELGDGDFERIKADGRDRWNEILGRIEVEDNDIDHLRTFYSCLYRSVLFPRNLSEVDASGKTVHYSPFDGEVHDGHMFTDTGFWDTFRALFPLLNLVYPDMNEKMQEGLVNTYMESGFLPEWASPGHRGCMVGNNSASVVADAYLKGIRGYDVETLWDAVVHGTQGVHPNVPSTGRLGWNYYNELGYVPCNVGINESAARTLEYAYDDWCIYQFGKALGKDESELAVFKERALNYQNLFDPEFSLMCGRQEDGQFARPFNPLKWGGDFTEGNSLHYTWSVFHDPKGLADLMGGDDKFNGLLDSIFSIAPLFDDSYYGSTIHEIREMQIMNTGNYAHGNQPIQHMIYLYDWSGQPWKVQEKVRMVMDRFYNAMPDGYCGDEDNGQTSAWYVFSALGFYPVCPGSGEYALGTPLFKKATVHLLNGKDIVIDAPDNSRTDFYVEKMKLNGKVYENTFIRHDALVKGAKISYRMSSEPDMERGTAAANRPYSFSDEK